MIENQNQDLQHWPVDRLIEYVRNPRKNDHAVDRVAAAIREFGFRVPVIAKSDGTVVDGHLRLKAAKKLGLEAIPVLLADDMTEAQIKAFRISVNRMAELADWDDELLALELADLVDLDFDLSLTGFDEDELNRLLDMEEDAGTEGLTDPDDAPEVQAEAVSKPGDAWVMGRHRIVCGSSTDPLVVEKALNGVTPHLMVTDPPYGVEYDADWRNKAMRADGTTIAGRAVGKVMNDDRADWSEAWALFPGDVAYVWHAGLFAATVAQSLESCDFQLRSQIIWAKSQFAIGRGDYHWKHEPCWYGVRKGRTGHSQGDRTQTTLWEIPKPAKSETGHSTPKPVECMLRPIQNNSSPGQAVYEPFSGSGTTIIACEQSGRACHAIELNPLYVDVAVRRWMAFTGQPAILESTGETFPTDVPEPEVVTG